MTDRDLVGKVAIVTGAAQGIGEATAVALGKRGATLVLTDINLERLDRVAAEIKADEKPTVVGADLAHADGPGAVVEAALEANGRIDMLASVAGVSGRGTILDTSLQQWEAMTNLHLRAHFLLIQGVARHLVERDAPGSIACAGSLNSYGGQPDLCAYSAAKGGLVTLVKNTAFALLSHQIRVNIANFGWMHTPGEVEIQAEIYGRDEAGLAAVAAELPFGRLIQPPEAAKLLTYLLTDDSSVMTGSVVDFDQSVPGSGPTTGLKAGPLSL